MYIIQHAAIVKYTPRIFDMRTKKKQKRGSNINHLFKSLCTQRKKMRTGKIRTKRSVCACHCKCQQNKKIIIEKASIEGATVQRKAKKKIKLSEKRGTAIMLFLPLKRSLVGC